MIPVIKRLHAAHSSGCGVCAGWIAFWWASWQLVTKVFDVARGSIALTASSLQGATAKGHTKIAVIDGQPHVLNAL